MPSVAERMVARTRDHVSAGLVSLQIAMKCKPGTYPDPKTPIEKWQRAHEHLLAAQELLKGE